MTFKDLLRKRDKARHGDSPQPLSPRLAPPEFTFIRSDTHTQEYIQPPSFGDSPTSPTASQDSVFGRLRRSSNASEPSLGHRRLPSSEKGGEKRLSHRLHLNRSSRSSSTSSVNIPANLPTVKHDGNAQDREAQWEKRATVLAQGTINVMPPSPLSPRRRPRSSSGGPLSDPKDDVRLSSSGSCVVEYSTKPKSDVAR